MMTYLVLKMKLKYLIRYTLLACVLVAGAVNEAQAQDPEFTHYMYNQKIINPGYVNDTPETLHFGAFFRKQWVDVIGNPTTYSFFSHLPL